MKKFIAENKIAVAAIVFDILTITAIIVSFTYDLITWVAVAFGIFAVVLNVKAKREQKERFKSRNE